jgi:DNA-binding response OmpR family regulator
VTVDNNRVVLSHTEFRLLEYLMRRAEDTVSRHDLALYVWDGKDDCGSNVMDVYVSYLRKKLGRASGLIRTVRGIGYTMTAQDGQRV